MDATPVKRTSLLCVPMKRMSIGTGGVGRFVACEYEELAMPMLLDHGHGNQVELTAKRGLEYWPEAECRASTA